MNRRITRRRFGQLAIASTTIAGIGYFATKTTAQQTSNLVIVGVGRGSFTPPNNQLNIANADSFSAAATDTSANAPNVQAPNSNRQLVIQTLNLGNNQVQSLAAPQSVTSQSVQSDNANANQNNNGQTPVLTTGELLGGITYLSDRSTLAVAIIPDNFSRGNNRSRLTLVGNSPRSIPISGLSQQETLNSLLLLNDGSLIGLVIRKDGTPPARIVNVNPQTGQISNRVNLPSNQPFFNLAQCPDGKIYTNTVGQRKVTQLTQLNLAQGTPINSVPLHINNRDWVNGFNSLVCSAAGQLFAFGANWHETRQHLHSINPSTGELIRLQPFDVARIAIRPV